jgi:hypothetical protein
MADAVGKKSSPPHSPLHRPIAFHLNQDEPRQTAMRLLHGRIQSRYQFQEGSGAHSLLHGLFAAE